MKLRRLLTSRRLAVWLIAGLTVYVFLVTLIPQGASDAEKVVKWDSSHAVAASIVKTTGMHRAYATPWFIVAAVWLTLSTAVCAWDRTRSSVEEWKRRGKMTPAIARRLKERPALAIPVPPSITDDEAMRTAGDVLRKARLRTVSGATVLEASGNHVGLLGSPLFHWLLVALIAVIAAGRLTHSEGGIALIMGGAKSEVHESYSRGLQEGPLFFERHTGLQLKLTGFEPDLVTPDGIERGVAARAELWDGDTKVRDRLVYPNKPMRYSTLTIYRQSDGRAAVIEVKMPGQPKPQEAPLMFVESAGTAGGYGIISTPFVAPSGRKYTASFHLISEGRLGVELADGDKVVASGAVRKGESLKLVEGASLEPREFARWVQFTVVNDWSIFYVYVLFGLVSAVAGLSVLLPPRRVWVMLVNAEGGRCLHIEVRARKADPSFAIRTLQALESAFRTASPEEVAS